MVTGAPSLPMAGSMGSLLDVGGKIVFLLPAARIQPLTEIAIAVEQADSDQRNTEIGGALDMIARQYAKSAGVKSATDSWIPNSAEKYATGRGRRTLACVAAHVRSAFTYFCMRRYASLIRLWSISSPARRSMVASGISSSNEIGL